MKVGDKAPDFELRTINGETLRISKLWKEKPTFILSGSYSCGLFRNTRGEFENFKREFGKEIHFLFLYTLEAHPKDVPCPYGAQIGMPEYNYRDQILIDQPKTLEERIEMARLCVDALKMTGPVVVDTMDNAVWKAYGGGPNFAYLVGRDGRVMALQEGVFKPESMRPELEKCFKEIAGQRF